MTEKEEAARKTNIQLGREWNADAKTMPVNHN